MKINRRAEPSIARPEVVRIRKTRAETGNAVSRFPVLPLPAAWSIPQNLAVVTKALELQGCKRPVPPH